MTLTAAHKLILKIEFLGSSRILILVLLIVCSGSSYSFCKSNYLKQSLNVDVELRKALSQQNLNDFTKSLELGGDPTKKFDDTQSGWVFCIATKLGNEQYLEHIIDSGFDVNFRQEDISPEISLPLSCAVRSNNLAAVKLLVQAGADPAESICVRCNERLPSSLLSESVMVGKYTLANWFMDYGGYSDFQYETVVDLIERFPLPKNSNKKELEFELVRKLEVKGFQVAYEAR